jgi:uncharacterized membrane protein
MNEIPMVTLIRLELALPVAHCGLFKLLELLEELLELLELLEEDGLSLVVAVELGVAGTVSVVEMLVVEVELGDAAVFFLPPVTA